MSTDDDVARPSGADPLAALSAPRTGWIARIEDATGGLVPVPSRAVAFGLAALAVLLIGGWLVANRAVEVEPLPYTTTPAHRAGTTIHALVGGDAGASPPTALVAPIAPPPTGTAPATVWVSAAGAVARPGLYQLRAGARLSELLAVAGGLTADADPDRINLAAVVRDGERIYLPHRGEQAAPSVIAGGAPGGGTVSGADGGSAGSGSASGGGAAPAPSPAAPLNLNTATAEELDRLPGVGPSTAAAIIDHRTRQGPFATVDDLRLVRGIGPAKLDALRGLVVV